MILRGRTLVVFAGEDPATCFRAVYLQVELPGVDGVLVRWGRSYLTPVLRALGEGQPCLVVYVDGHRWRLFELELAAIVETEAAVRALLRAHGGPARAR